MISMCKLVRRSDGAISGEATNSWASRRHVQGMFRTSCSPMLMGCRQQLHAIVRPYRISGCEDNLTDGLHPTRPGWPAYPATQRRFSLYRNSNRGGLRHLDVRICIGSSAAVCTYVCIEGDLLRIRDQYAVLQSVV